MVLAAEGNLNSAEEEVCRFAAEDDDIGEIDRMFSPPIPLPPSRRQRLKSRFHKYRDRIFPSDKLGSDDEPSFTSPPPDDEKQVELERIYGFQHCPQLEGSAFNMAAELYPEPIMRILQSRLHVPLSDNLERFRRLKYGIDLDWANLNANKNMLGKYLRRFWMNIKESFAALVGKRRPHLYARDVKEHLAKIIDADAQEIYHETVSRYNVHDCSIQLPWNKYKYGISPICPEAAHRFSCFMAADSFNRWSRHSKYDRLLHYVDGPSYFNHTIAFKHLDIELANWEAERKPEVPAIKKIAGEVHSSLNPLPERIPPSRIPHIKNKIAYFLMVHNNFGNIKAIIEQIYDEAAVILIHVDKKNLKLKKQVSQYLNMHSERFDSDRIRVMRHSFNCAWGHSSLVFAQTAGMFELLEMNADWEYWINISGNDYPLVTNTEIYRQLNLTALLYPHPNWIEYWTDADTRNRLSTRPCLLSQGNKAGDAYPPLFDGYFGERFKFMSFPYPKWKLYKHHQWMILNRKLVETMRKSPTAMFYLAYNEFTNIPDESFYATFAMNTATRDENTGKPSQTSVVNYSKRYLEFEMFAAHPRSLTTKDQNELRSKAMYGAIFTRKVDIVNEKKLVSWINENKRNGWWSGARPKSLRSSQPSSTSSRSSPFSGSYSSGSSSS